MAQRGARADTSVELSEQTRNIVKDATDDVKKLSLLKLPQERETSYIPRTSPARLTQAKLQREFQQALAAFQSIQRAEVKKEKAALESVKSRGDERTPHGRGYVGRRSLLTHADTRMSTCLMRGSAATLVRRAHSRSKSRYRSRGHRKQRSSSRS